MYEQYIGRGQVVYPLYGGCPLSRVSIIGGSPVYRIYSERESLEQG